MIYTVCAGLCSGAACRMTFNGYHRQMWKAGRGQNVELYPFMKRSVRRQYRRAESAGKKRTNRKEAVIGKGITASLLLTETLRQQGCGQNTETGCQSPENSQRQYYRKKEIRPQSM